LSTLGGLFTVVLGTEPATLVTLANVAVEDSRRFGFVEFTVEETLALLDWNALVGVVEDVAFWALATGNAHVFAFLFGLAEGATALSASGTAFLPNLTGWTRNLANVGVFSPCV
jgi:hypothetical protein